MKRLEVVLVLVCLAFVASYFVYFSHRAPGDLATVVEAAVVGAQEKQTQCAICEARLPVSAMQQGKCYMQHRISVWCPEARQLIWTGVCEKCWGGLSNDQRAKIVEQRWVAKDVPISIRTAFLQDIRTGDAGAGIKHLVEIP